jgi:hypothetical protein
MENHVSLNWKSMKGSCEEVHQAAHALPILDFDKKVIKASLASYKNANSKDKIMVDLEALTYSL